MPPLTDRPPPRVLPATPGRRWLAGDLHTHTVHSDGVMTVPELARFAAGRGMDYIAVTDHNTISHHAELPAAAAVHGITLIPGQEVTDRGRARERVRRRRLDRLPASPPMTGSTRASRLAACCRSTIPYGGQVGWTAPMKRRPPLLEVWHWSWLDTRWTAPLGWWQAWDPAAVPVGGSDWHQPGSDAPPGSPTTWVEAEVDDPAAVLAALAAGRTAISAAGTARCCCESATSSSPATADGAILVGPDGPKARVRGPLAKFPAAEGAHRLVDPDGATLALTG